MAVSPSRSLPPLRVSNGRRSTSACSDVLQNKLRKLLNTDSRENISITNNTDCLVDDFTPISPPAEYAITERSSYRYVYINVDNSKFPFLPLGVLQSLPFLDTNNIYIFLRNNYLSIYFIKQNYTTKNLIIK